jgi:hypothetical protein
MGPKIEIPEFAEAKQNESNAKYDAYSLKAVKRNIENVQFNIHAMKNRINERDVKISDIDKCNEALNRISTDLAQLVEYVNNEMIIAELLDT